MALCEFGEKCKYAERERTKDRERKQQQQHQKKVNNCDECEIGSVEKEWNRMASNIQSKHLDPSNLLVWYSCA